MIMLMCCMSTVSFLEPITHALACSSVALDRNKKKQTHVAHKRDSVTFNKAWVKIAASSFKFLKKSQAKLSWLIWFPQHIRKYRCYLGTVMLTLLVENSCVDIWFLSHLGFFLALRPEEKPMKKTQHERQTILTFGSIQKLSSFILQQKKFLNHFQSYHHVLVFYNFIFCQ